jgi:putative PEP-CTERM system TPR-repeat lipoprotein
LAQAQFATDDKTAALKNYERLAVLLPESAPLQMKIAAVQIAMGNKPATSEAVKKALLLQPDYLDAQVLQASLYMRDGNAVQAIAMAKRIQKQPGQAARGYELEGDILMSQKQFDPAANAYGQAFATNKQNPTMLMKLLGSLKLAGKVKAAEVLINQWFKDHPKDSALHMYLAGTYLTLKQNKAAIEQYQLVLLQEPENIAALNNLAWSYQQEQDPRALETAEKAYRLAPESPPIADTLGWLLVQRGDTKRGIDILQKASTASAGAPDIRYHLVLALQKAGDKTKAQSELQQLLASGKPFAQIDEAKSLLNTM